ncbi:PAS-domain containing protein [Hydrogenophilus thiooxidans]|uniref:PAS-domain containing protein n=1 Tax=Hydrogenophilus thiooxidans TaxID=2820326 RepID=UPI001C22362D|nr:PAS-domain containing protein [Hydrogenophilus thiooxidans]
MPSPQDRRRYDLLLAGLDLLDQAIAVFDAEPKLVAWNQALSRLLDFPPELVREGTPFEAFVRFNAERGEYGDGAIEKLVAERMAAARSFQPHYFERQRPNGRILAVRGVPIPNLGFVSLWTDITELRQNERLIEEQNQQLEARVRERTQELARAYQELREAQRELEATAEALAYSEARLRLILDSIPAMVAYVDREQRYRYANRVYADWFETTPEAIVGQTIAEVVGAEVFAQIETHLERALTGERVTYEYHRTRANGKRVFARSTVVPEKRGDEVVGFFVLSFDISEQRAQQEALIQAQKMEAVGQLTGGIAHDFNNLLTIILGNLEALDEALTARSLASLAREHIAPAVRATRRGVDLVKRLLTFSRRQPMALAPVEVGERVRGLGVLLARTLGELVTLDLRLPEAPLYAHTDGHQLENALLNLALNARDAMSPAGGTLTIRVLPCEILADLAQRYGLTPGRYVQFDVIDTGCGMAPEVLAHVFEPFFTTKPFGRGSGLGLAMVYGFVRQSGGAIRIRSEPGVGTTVTFVLPRCEPPAPSSDPGPAAQPGTVPRSLTILLVEDEPEVRHLLRQMVMRLGHRVLEAENGAEALELIEHVAEIDVVVTDAVMPGGCDGGTLIARARALRPGLPAVLVSGYWHEAPTLPDVPALAKPVSQAALAEALRSVTIRNVAHPATQKEER